MGCMRLSLHGFVRKDSFDDLIFQMDNVYAHT